MSAYAAIAVSALRAARPAGRISKCTVAVVLMYVVSFAAMVLANAVYERGITQYIVVQAAGLLLMSGFTAFPVIARRRTAPAEPEDRRDHIAA
ncbi:hypothetical protein [Mycobacterium intermedium]|uniref:hypothetical protein n=1 Tax=Mycobacterium intermedium TaxID=28445 RepID=UPI0008487CA0|nr:hypothetical protein [Mycobacterium intermedium]ODQ94327.1 hypothetical protein BHQ20_29535 [Mycobacterium intermedium]